MRFVAATHRDLEAMVARGEFREDLFYRLNVVPIWLPPLRERREDIAARSRVHFCALHARANGRPEHALAAGRARGCSARSRWPGNVRQLENFVERLVVLSDGPLLTRRRTCERELARGSAARSIARRRGAGAGRTGRAASSTIARRARSGKR